MTVVIGTGESRKSRLYYSAAFATPSWVRIARIKGHKLPLGKKTGQADGNDLAAEINLPGILQVGPLSFQYRHKKGSTDSVFAALWDSYVNDTHLLWAESDAAITDDGMQAITMPGYVSKIDKAVESPEAIVYDVEVVYSETYDESGNLVELNYMGEPGGGTTTAAPTTTTAA